MRIEVYGKQGCGLCKSAQKKISKFLEKWEVHDQLPVNFMDMETPHGAAEGDFFDVFEVPTVLVLCEEDSVLGRWDGKAPPSAELEAIVRPDEQQAAA